MTQRTAEMGIRQALGAAPRQVWSLVMWQAMMLAVSGTFLGLIAAAWMGRSLSTLVYGINSFDLPSFVGGSVVFLTVAAAASLIPALRAASETADVPSALHIIEQPDRGECGIALQTSIDDRPERLDFRRSIPTRRRRDLTGFDVALELTLGDPAIDGASIQTELSGDARFRDALLR